MKIAKVIKKIYQILRVTTINNDHQDEAMLFSANTEYKQKAPIGIKRHTIWE